MEVGTGPRLPQEPRPMPDGFRHHASTIPPRAQPGCSQSGDDAAATASHIQDPTRPHKLLASFFIPSYARFAAHTNIHTTYACTQHTYTVRPLLSSLNSDVVGCRSECRAAVRSAKVYLQILVHGYKPTR